MPRPIADRRIHAHHARQTAPASSQSLLLERAESRISELEAENARLRHELGSVRRSSAPFPLSLLSPQQTVWLVLAGLGVSLAFLFHTLRK